MEILPDVPPPPAHLSPSSAQLWRSTVERFILEPHHLVLLKVLCEGLDRYETARQQLQCEGLTVAGREGGIRPHPAAAIARDTALLIARMVRELDLDISAPSSDHVAPPPILSNSNRSAHARKRARA
jgi:P27 family predicted phage terminase small subunit